MKVAIVGAGGMGRAWTDTLERAALAEVVAFVDPLIGMATPPEWLDGRPGARAATLVEVADSGVDAVVITALSPAHAEVIETALRLGLHVLVEKPFTTSRADAERLVALAAAEERLLMVSQNYRFFPGSQRVRALAAGGELGPIRAVIGRFWCDWPGKPYQHRMQHPMGLEMAIHHYDMVRALFDAEPESGRVEEWNPAWSPYRSGGAVEAVFAMRTPHHRFPFLYSGSLVGRAPRTPWGGLWRFEFEDATLIADVLEGRYGLYRAAGEDYELLGPFAGETMELDASFRHFAACVREEREPWSSGRDNLGTLRMALDFVAGTGDQAGEAVAGSGERS